MRSATLLLLWYQGGVIARTGSVAIKTDNVHYKSDLMLNAAVIVALVRIRDRRTWRFTGIGVAIAGAVTYASLVATGTSMSVTYVVDIAALIAQLFGGSK